MLKLLSFVGTLLVCTTLTALAEIDQDWWKHTIVYQIYPRSFKDSNGDGVGDLKGIESKLDYLKELGIDTIWLSPIYTSPMADFGYDVADFKDIDSIFGTMKDFNELLEAVHQRDMYLMMDLIPNHSSDKHQWFIESVKGGDDNPYSDYYCWNDGKVLEDGSRAPPNNWMSIFGGSAWEWVEERQQYYLHQFVKEQPDLNYRNPKVIEEMKDVWRFWMEKGVDGFRVDAIGTLFENEELLDEPLSNDPKALPTQHGFLSHPYTLDQSEIHDVVKEWREVLDEYDAESGRHTFVVMEIYDPLLDEAMKYYDSGADMPFNFNLIFLNQSCGGKCTHDLIDSWFKKMPQDEWANFVLGNHDNLRITTRKGPIYANALNMLLLTLPGTPTTYYGEEIGLRDIKVAYEDTQDPWGINMGPDYYEKYSRDPARAPMQWCSGQNAGFSTADKTWLPVNADYTTRNVEAQQTDESGKSTLQIYKQLASLRKEQAFRNSKIEYKTINENIISYVRKADDTSYLVALNLGDKQSTDDYVINIDDDVIKKGVVVVDTGTVSSKIKVEESINLNKLLLKPGDGLVIKLNTASSKKEEL